MPEIKPIIGDRNGGFYVKFAQDASTCDFYGEEISEFQAFRRYGNLPDNNILGNKLINALGKNLLNLEKEASTLDENSSISWERRVERRAYSIMERESNAFHISLLDTLVKLEKHRSHDGNNTFNKGKIAQELESAVTALYQDRIARLTHKIGTSLEPEKSRLQKILDKMSSSEKKICNLLRDKETNLQTLYRQVMDNFAAEQRLISIYQHDASRPLDYANRSLTEGYQNASYAMEKHVFSMHNPTNEQLWIPTQDPENAQDILLDSRHYQSMRKEDALYSACLVGTEGHSFEAVKAEIMAESAKNRVKKVATKIDEKPRDEAARDVLKSKKPETDAVIRMTQALITESPDDEARAFVKNTWRLPGERPVALHHASDLWSSIGLAVTDVAKYIECENAAKKPVMTAAAFVAMAATFGAAGLASAGVQSMHGLSAAMAKFFTLNGKLGITPDQLQSVVNAISNEWLDLTFSAGSKVHILIMNGFGLPQLNYVVFDEILNGSANKSTFDMLTARLASQDLAAYTDDEKQQQLAHKLAFYGTLVIASIALGLAASTAMKAGGLAHTLGSMVGSFIEIPIEAFTNLGVGSIGGKLLALTALALTIKSSGLFLGKIMLVLNHMKDELSEEQQEAVHFMGLLREAADSGQLNPEQLTALKDRDDFKFYRTHFEDVMDKDPQLEALFGVEFLNQVGVTKPPLSGYDKVVNWFASGAKTGWHKTVKPFLQMVFGSILSVASLGLFLYLGKNDDWGLREGAVNAGLFLGRVFTGVAAMGKTVSISIYGTVQRVAMAASDLLFDIFAVMKHPIKSVFGLMMVGKAALLATSVAMDVLRFAVTLTKYALGVVGALLGAPFGKAGNAFKAILAGGSKIQEGLMAVKNVLANVTYSIDKSVYDNKLLGARDATTAAIASGFDGFKGLMGKVAYGVRNLFVRTAEHKLQAMHIDELMTDQVSAFEDMSVTRRTSLTTMHNLGGQGPRSRVAAGQSASVDDDAVAQPDSPTVDDDYGDDESARESIRL